MTWPSAKGDLPDRSPGPSSPNMFESSTYTVVPSGLTASRVGIFPAAIAGSARPSASRIGVTLPDA